MKKIFEDFIALIRDSNAVISTDRREVERLAESHGMTAFAVTDEKDKRRNLVMYKHFMLMQEYEAVKLLFEKNNIRYMPLKGAVLCSLYPKPYMREMSDIDILVDKENLETIRKLMQDNGFKYSQSVYPDPDVFTKAAGVSFEVHNTLVTLNKQTGFDEFFADPWSMAECDGLCYRLTPENEYIYILVHMYGHFHLGGSGVRGILDLYLYRKNNNIDFEVVQDAFEKCGIKQFADNIHMLMEVWFEGKPGNKLTDELGEFIMTSGTYGTRERYNMRVYDSNRSTLENVGKIAKREIFLSKDKIVSRYPWAENSLLLPAAYTHRIYRILKNKGSTAVHWVKALAKTDRKAALEFQRKMKRFGVADYERTAE